MKGALGAAMGVIWNMLWLSSAHRFAFDLLNSTQSQSSHFHMVNNSNVSWIIYGHSFILRREVSGPGSPMFACGFGTSDDPDRSHFYFGIFVVRGRRKIVWSPNRNKPVGINASLVLTGDGDLILQDDDGTVVWSTNTKGRSVAGLNLTESGNLVLYGTNNATIWQSFDQPTDTLLLGQKLYTGQKLTASNSSTNLSQGGIYSLSLSNEYLFAFVESDPSLVYCRRYFWDKRITEEHYATLLDGDFAVYSAVSNIKQWDSIVDGVLIPRATSLQHVSLDFDGHFRVYDWAAGEWQPVADILTPYISNCGYPLVCGRYGICSTLVDNSAACSCPQAADNPKFSYFRLSTDWQPNLGCSAINPLSCENPKYQKMIEIKNVTHIKGEPDIRMTDRNTCQKVCLDNCSCKAAMFDSTSRTCYLISQVLSLQHHEDAFQLFLKVQDDSGIPSTPQSKRKIRPRAMVLAWSVGAVSVLLLICVYIALSRKKKDADDEGEDYLNHVPGMPKRYFYEELMAATNNFNKKLGQGGFGSVFEGILSDGTRVAVKCLDGLGQIKDSFLSEVKTIGSIHHVNLLRLIGYCAMKSDRLLVYEFMCNGSLDKWIFHGNPECFSLGWQTRKMIILDIAKGLAYLHEDCSQKIFHLDIKPQNILLDANFQAKVADFGLSKLIDRDQSQVVTIMKGTPGYMAPEWLNSVITEKVDVYSFGVVVLEILCGRKNLDRSQPEEEMHLLSVFKKKAKQDQLLDMIDKNSVDMLSNGEEVLKMMKVAAWCLQSNSAKRPSMSVVVKVLEGLVNVEENLEYEFSIPHVRGSAVIPGAKMGVTNAATPLLPSTLSGPR